MTAPLRRALAVPCWHYGAAAWPFPLLAVVTWSVSTGQPFPLLATAVQALCWAAFLVLAVLAVAALLVSEHAQAPAPVAPVQRPAGGAPTAPAGPPAPTSTMPPLSSELADLVGSLAPAGGAS